MSNLGETIRELRERKSLTLRTVAGYLQIDQAILSKIERGQRKASREHVLKLARYFEADQSDLLTEWLSDRVALEVSGEEVAIKALRLAEEKIKYVTSVNNRRRP